MAAVSCGGVSGGVIRLWYLSCRRGTSWMGASRPGRGVAAASSGFGAILISSNGLALRGGGG